MRTAWKQAWVVGLLGAMAATGWTAPARGTRAEPYRPDEDRPVAAITTPADRSSLPTLGEGPADEATNVTVGARTLRRGDKIDVSLRGLPQPPETFTCVIDEDGKINMPLIGDVEIAGLKTPDAQKKIENEYIERQIYKRITVIIVPPQGEYTVTGEVLNPGAYMLSRELKLSMALARAGRFTDFADSTKIHIMRGKEIINVNFKRVQEGRDQDPIILPGDVIAVPRSPW